MSKSRKHNKDREEHDEGVEKKKVQDHAPRKQKHLKNALRAKDIDYLRLLDEDL